MIAILQKVNGFIWGVPALLLILSVGIYLSIKTNFAQVRLFPKAMKAFFSKFTNKNNGEGISSKQALCTALAATVGTGNLAGVAGAIAIGGPGAIFWMWICAFLGMVTKFAEATLAVRYRERNKAGELIGGPMYMIRNGLGKKWTFLSSIYCFFGTVAAFGVGNATQINTVINGINTTLTAFGGEVTTGLDLFVGIILAVCIGVILFGGAKKIAAFAERLVPLAALIYIVLCIGVLILRIREIPNAFQSIIQGIYKPQAVTGGVLGSAFAALRVGASRGVFTNEAGMGTAAIAHASAQVKHPVEQGLMGIVEVFLDTIVICTLTALVILCSGIHISYGTDTGIVLTTQAFSNIYGDWVCVVITISLCLFAIATVLGWGLYGARCAEYLFGNKAWKKFVCLQMIMVVAGALLRTETAWLMSEIMNGLMAIPNLLALICLTPELCRLLREYKST